MLDVGFWKTVEIFVAPLFLGNPALRIVQLAHQRERTYDGERRVIRAFEITLDTVGPPWHLSHLAEMYGSNPRRACSVSRTTEQEQARLEKMKELTNMLKVHSRQRSFTRPVISSPLCSEKSASLFDDSKSWLDLLRRTRTRTSPYARRYWRLT
jgi:hypothetical protein